MVFPQAKKKLEKRFLVVVQKVEVIEQLDRSVMAIRGATRNSNMKYVSTHVVVVATYTKNRVYVCIP